MVDAAVDERQEGLADSDSRLTYAQRLSLQTGILRRRAVRDRLAFLLRTAEMSLTAQPALAAECFIHALLIAPDDEAALRGLQNLLLSGTCIERIVPVLVAVLASPQSLSLAALVGMQTPSGDVPPDEPLVPGTPFDLAAGLKDLAELFVQRDDIELAAATLGQSAERTSGAARAALFLRVGGLFEQRLEAPERALQAFQDALDADPGCTEAFDALRRLFNAGLRSGEHTERLAAYYARTGDFEALLSLRQGMAAAALDDRQRAQLSVQVGRLLLDELERPLEAVDWLRRAFELSPDDDGLRAELVALGERVNAHELVASALDTAAQRAQDPQRRVQLSLQAGRMRYERLRDRPWAASTFERVLASDPRNAEALALLDACLVDLGRYTELDDVLRRRLDVEHDPELRERLLVRRSEILRHILGRPDEADLALREALEARADDPEALRQLADLHRERGAWADLVRVLESQVDRQSDPETALRLLQELAALTEERLRDPARLLAVARRTLLIRPDDAAPLEWVVRLALATGDALVAAEAAEELAGRSPSAEKRVEQRLRAAEWAERPPGDTARAIQLYEAVLVDAPAHPVACEALERLYEHGGRFAALLDFLEKQLEYASPADQARLHRRRGTLLSERLRNPEAAVAEFKAALALDPADVDTHWALSTALGDTGRHAERLAVLKRLRTLARDLPSRQRVFRAMQQTLERLIDQAETRPEEASHCIDLARLMLDQEPGDSRAIQLLERALSADPTRIEALHTLAELVARREGVRAMAERYRALLAQLDAANRHDLVLSIARELGSLAEARLRDRALAIYAYEQVVAHERDDVDARERLADLYFQQGDLVHAAEAHLHVLRFKPERQESYRALKQIFMDTREFDKAWVVSGVLVGVDRGDRAEEQFYRRHPGQSIQAGAPPLGDAQWRALIEPEGERRLALCHLFHEVFEALGPQLAVADLKAYGLRRTNEMPLDKNAELPFVRVVNTAAAIVGAPPPRVYFLQGATGVTLAATLPPAIVVGPDALTEREPAALLALVARQLVLTNPLFCMAALLPVRQLHTILRAVWRFGAPERANEPAPDDVLDIARQLQRRLDGVRLERVRKLLAALPGATLVDTVEAWVEAVDRLAGRTGLLLCGKPDAAIRVLARPGPIPLDLPAALRIADLARFGVDPTHFALRAHYGLTAGTAQ